MSNIQTIPIAKIKESKSNPRKTFDTKSLQELADSIKAQGVLQPPLVRPKGKNFELVCGARRYRASMLAGLTDLDVYVREMTDEQVLDAQIVENLQREDVHPLEEAECIQKLLGSKLYDSPQAVADKIGRPVKFVLLRMKLTTLHQSVKKALQEGEIGIGWAELASTVDLDVQADALASSRQYHGPKTASGLRQWFRNQQIELSKAPFDINDPSLNPERGACIGCQYNTDNSLLPDETPMCMRRSCFEKKCSANLEVVLADYKAKGLKLVKLSQPYSGGKGLKEWNAAEQKTRGAELGIIIDNRNPEKIGSLVYFTRWNDGSTSNSNSSKLSGEKLVARKAELKSQRVENAYRWRLYQACRSALETHFGKVEYEHSPMNFERDVFPHIAAFIAMNMEKPSNAKYGFSTPEFEEEIGFDSSGRISYWKREHTHRSELSKGLTQCDSMKIVLASIARWEVPFNDYHQPEMPGLNAFATFLKIDKELIRKEAEIELMSKKERKEAGL